MVAMNENEGKAMTNEKIYFPCRERDNEDYIADLENRLLEKEIEARKAKKRAAAYRQQAARQRAARRAERNRMMRAINFAATGIALVATYWWVLAASAGGIPAWTAGIPLTIGLAAAYRWGKY